MKKSSIIALLIIAAGIGLMVSMVGDYSTYETFESSKKNPDKEIHVVGFLDKAQPLKYEPLTDANRFEFFMKDKKGEQCKVIFKGSKPQDFEKSEQIVLTGKMVGSEFHASTMLMKCPSKYTNDKIETKSFKANT
jgi:cytochrome c-type biogenesis protein CcmE